MRTEAMAAGLVAHIFLVPYPPGALHGQPHATAEEHHTLEGRAKGVLGRVISIPIPRREGPRRMSTWNREGGCDTESHQGMKLTLCLPGIPHRAEK